MQCKTSKTYVSNFLLAFFTMRANVLPHLLLLLLLLLLHRTRGLIGGDDAVPRQFPFQALVRGFFEDPVRDFGTGVLIHPEWVLTTAETIADFTAINVTLGVIHRDSTAPWRQDIPVLQVHVHPEWPGRKHWENMHLNDIGLLKLSHPAQLNDRVQLAYLPRKRSYDGHRLTVSGWGLHLGDMPPYGYRTQNTLKWEVTSTISFLECFWKRFSVSDHTGWIHMNHICADTQGQGPCYDDGGAPLMLMTEAGTKGIVLGLFTTPTVYSEACQTNVPSVYTHVYSHLGWIEKVSSVTPPQ